MLRVPQSEGISLQPECELAPTQLHPEAPGQWGSCSVKSRWNLMSLIIFFRALQAVRKITCHPLFEFHKEKWVEHLNRHTARQQTQDEELKVTHHQRDANYSHSEAATHTRQSGCYQ